MELFPPAWFTAGVVDSASAADFARYASAAPQKPARHWKWLAFRDWCEEREPLSAAECRTIFALGETDEDVNLGTAMMCHALLERNCPADVRTAGQQSSRAAVRRAAGV